MLGIIEIFGSHFCAYCTYIFYYFHPLRDFSSHLFTGISNVSEIDNPLCIFYTEHRDKTNAAPKERKKE